MKRSVSKISWYPDNPTKLAVSYAIMRFQQMPEGMPTQVKFCFIVYIKNAKVLYLGCE